MTVLMLRITTSNCVSVLARVKLFIPLSASVLVRRVGLLRVEHIRYRSSEIDLNYCLICEAVLF